MLDSMIYFWISFGAILILGELILPGLVSIFVGFGALTVAYLLHLNMIEGISPQLIVWFISSIIYIFSLRLLVMKYYPSDRREQDIDEDRAVIGKTALVSEKINKLQKGRIHFGDTTWVAISEGDEEFAVGDTVEIVRRDNISWVVTSPQKEEN